MLSEHLNFLQYHIAYEGDKGLIHMGRKLAFAEVLKQSMKQGRS